MNTEIGKTGEVIVEGHAIGRLDGFTFAPDAAEAGSDAKALQAAAQQVLASEIDTRATKLAAAPDDQFVLTSDGTIRWTGDAVAKLVAADDALHPRIRIIADDRLSGAPREAVQARLDLWLKTHIEKLLGPLFGLVEGRGHHRHRTRHRVPAGRGARRAGARQDLRRDEGSRPGLARDACANTACGSAPITSISPACLKPAARALASLLWAEKQDNVDMSALSGAQHLAQSGRTSFPVDKALHRDAYRVLGYRQCGERAVRVDILERLADLIRPALAWRETSPGEKPTGAFDGRGFVVTQAMTSLTGSAGEDFASILRALGYRMDKRPPLPPKPAPVEVVETVAAETPPVEASAETTVDTVGRDDGGDARRRSRRRTADLGRSRAVGLAAAECHAGGRSDRDVAPAETTPAKPHCGACRRSSEPLSAAKQAEAASAPEAAAEPAASEAAAV